MQNDTNTKSSSLTFPYPENRDKMVSYIILTSMFIGLLIYMALKEDNIFGKYGYFFAIFIVILQLSINLKTFILIDEVVINDKFLVLKKKGNIRSETPLQELAFKVTKNPIDYSNKIVLDFYNMTSNKHLVSLSNKDIPKETYEQFIQILSTASSRNKNDFQKTSHRQLLSLFPENMNERTAKGELIKATHNALF